MKALRHQPDQRLCLNDDGEHLLTYLAPEHANEEALRSLVDLYAQGTQVGQLLICVNYQRALFDSRVWQPLFDGYLPEGPDDQDMFRWVAQTKRTVFRERRKVHNLWQLARKGLDHFAIWLDQCRRRQVEGWLSIRMNDSHFTHDQRCNWHSQFWLEHPEFRLDTAGRPGQPGLDFSHPEVRAHYLTLVRELFERYDMDGLELDWMRFGYALPYGCERAERNVLSDFMREVRALSAICAQRTGRPVRLGVRVPDSVEASLSLGYDVITWIQSGLVDQVVPSSFYADQWLDYPTAIWKAVIDQRPVDLAICLYAEVMDPNTRKELPDSPATYRGAAGAALANGADLIYLFNTCYLADQFHAPEPPEVEHQLAIAGSHGTYTKHVREPRNAALAEILSTCGSLATIAGHPSRHILGDQQFVIAGGCSGRRFPASLSGRRLLFRFNTGPAPAPGGKVVLHLGFDRDALRNQESHGGNPLGEAAVWINGRRCVPASTPGDLEPITPEAACVRTWAVDPDAVNAGENLVAYQAPQFAGHVVWIELDMQPPSSAVKP